MAFKSYFLLEYSVLLFACHYFAEHIAGYNGNSNFDFL